MPRLSALTLPAVVLIAILVTALSFDRFFFHPNAYLLTPGGDGLKNYYTPAWYLKYDKGLHFSGMNAPFGEHITFTDNQPAISVPLNFVDDKIFGISGYAVGIFNMLMLLSLPLCAVFVYLLLRRFMLPAWYAAVCALIIAFLSPQLGRFMGHYALAYTFFVPLLWWLAIQMNDRSGVKAWWLTWLLCAVLLFFGLVHLYYLLMGTAFLLAYAFVLTISRDLRREPGRWSTILRNLTAALLPFVLVLLFLQLTDAVTDRPSAPYGFTRYAAAFESVFLPSSSPFVEVWKFFLRFRIPDFEGRAYVGLPGLLVALFLVFRLLRQGVAFLGLGGRAYAAKSRAAGTLHTARKSNRLHRLPAGMNYWITAAVLVLLFSMAIPFKWGLEFLLDLLPPIKQFRSPGRLAWVFYYVWTVFTAFYFYRLYRYIARRGIQGIAMTMLLGVLFFWGLEAAANVRNLRNYLYSFTFENPFQSSADTYAELLSQAGRTPAEYQGMLCLPYYMMGSEKLYIDRGSEAISKGMQASYQTGIPLMQGMLSRTSYNQTVQLVQLVSNPHIGRQLIPEMGGKPILVMALRGQLNRREADLVGRGKLIAGNDEMLYYELPVSAFVSDQVQVRKTFSEVRSGLLSIPPMDANGRGLSSHDSGLKAYADSTFGYYVIKSFENGSESGLLGQSALYQKSGTASLLDAAVDLPAGTALEFSVWVKAYADKAAFPRLWLRQYNHKGEVLDEKELNPKQSTDVWQEWVRVQSNLELEKGASRVECIMKGDRIGVDALLLRSLPADVYYEVTEDGGFFKNNWPVPAAECGC